ncbi:MAG: undecaprenyl/decaprenyl-phosphate alpha-N-acetylglucosaminyl 1-phosphate transferase [Oligoflexia bacterium]|nr:undecaprenyl/decaprenyl-phosphate alpha-N-acetylglucosaminyl 1-phosphate transferase [Oligoflexia bacterium]
MFFSLSFTTVCIFTFLTAFLIVCISTPVIIRVARLKSLLDEPGGRKLHNESIPTLGGIAIFSGTLISFSLFRDYLGLNDVRFMIPAILCLFLIGLKDDILIISPWTKLLGQITVAGLIVFFGDLRITSLYGVLGFTAIDLFPSILFSVLTVVVIINAFNLIDGINGLAGGIGLISASAFATWFLLTNNIGLALLALSLAGSLLAFLIFNLVKPKIFMGEIGPMITGLILSICAIQFIELNKHMESVGNFDYWIRASPVVAIAFLFLPLFDLLRVFIIRIYIGKSPLVADTNHIHHTLIRSGFSHLQSSLLLYLVQIFFMLLAIYFRDLRSSHLLPILLLGAMLFVFTASWYEKRYCLKC